TALKERLEAAGAAVHQLHGHDAEETLSQLESLCQGNAVPALFLMTARDERAFALSDRAHSEQEIERHIWLPYRAAQRWYQHVKRHAMHIPATIAATVHLGGGFGFEGEVPQPLSGALTGLLKSLH